VGLRGDGEASTPRLGIRLPHRWNFDDASRLRAVPFARYGKDRTLSVAHAAVIGDWWKRTDPATPAELKFIKRARDLALKEGARNSIAVASAQIFDWFEAQLNEIEANLPDD
jgi:hypothetical protein